LISGASRHFELHACITNSTRKAAHIYATIGAAAPNPPTCCSPESLAFLSSVVTDAAVFNDSVAEVVLEELGDSNSI
jgi:hypothetical protein